MDLKKIASAACTVLISDRLYKYLIKMAQLYDQYQQPEITSITDSRLMIYSGHQIKSIKH